MESSPGDSAERRVPGTEFDSRSHWHTFRPDPEHTTCDHGPDHPHATAGEITLKPIDPNTLPSPLRTFIEAIVERIENSDDPLDEIPEGSLMRGLTLNGAYVTNIVIMPTDDGFYELQSSDGEVVERVATIETAMRFGDLYLTAYKEGYIDGSTARDTQDQATDQSAGRTRRTRRTRHPSRHSGRDHPGHLDGDADPESGLGRD